jgi:hypothetical protein
MARKLIKNELVRPLVKAWIDAGYAHENWLEPHLCLPILNATRHSLLNDPTFSVCGNPSVPSKRRVLCTKLSFGYPKY